MKIFVDTSAWCALTDLKDKNHTKAGNLFNKINDKGYFLATSDYILDETLTLLRFKLGHPAAVMFGEDLLSSKVCQVFEIDQKIKQKAWDIFVKFDDKNFSFTDCTSFALIGELGIKSVFAFDVHFKQYGLNIFSD